MKQFIVKNKLCFVGSINDVLKQLRELSLNFKCVKEVIDDKLKFIDQNI